MLMKLVFLLGVTHLCLSDAVYLPEDNEQIFRRDSAVTQEPGGNPTVQINGTSARAGYVTQEVFDARIGALSSSLDKVKRDVGSVQSSLSSLTSDVGALTQNLHDFVSKTTTDIGSLDGRFSTLQNDYKNTVKQCLSGLIQVDWAGGRWTLLFKPPFSSTPSMVYGVTYFDDGLSQVRFRIDLESISRSQATLSMSTWAGSKIYKAAIAWMACK